MKFHGLSFAKVCLRNEKKKYVLYFKLGEQRLKYCHINQPTSLSLKRSVENLIKAQIFLLIFSSKLLIY